MGLLDRIKLIERPEDRVFEEVEEVTTIKVEWEDGAPVKFLLPSSERSPGGGDATKKRFSLNDVRAYAEEMAFHLCETSCRAEDCEYCDDIEMRVQGIGRKLAKTLVPKRVRRFLADLPESAVVHIETEEQWIPWEFVYDDKQQAFWGERYIIGRRLILSLDDEDLDMIQLKRRQTYSSLVTSILNVVGTIDSPQLAQSLFDSFVRDDHPMVHVNAADRGEFFSVSELKQIAKATDVINFTCHNRHSAGGDYLEMGPHPVDNHLYVFMVDQLHLNRCIVFVNACCSAAPSFVLNDILNLGCQFYLAGAEALIGTIAPVPTQHALQFARKFYGHLFKGETAGEALYWAKRESRRENDPFWLCYCLYGETSAIKQISDSIIG
jgi:hypothetical protein